MKFKLKKEIVIPKGTIFEKFPRGTVRTFYEDNISYIFCLTNDSSGEIIYGLEPLDKDLKNWFGEEE
jgi:hypothetical protein